jgi:two-component system, cell cycle response regulator
MKSTQPRPEEEKQKYSFLDGSSTVRTDREMSGHSAFIPTLTFLSGPALGKEIPLVHRELTLGRGEDCDIIIPDSSVSRRHLRISCREVVKGENKSMTVVIRDLSSKNGTLVNYEAVQKKSLKPGDKISIGRVILKYDCRDLAEQNFYDEIYRLATIDHLTSLLNKATITRTLFDELASSLRDCRWVSIILMDVDQFKSVNDVHGHLVGDRILQVVARIIESCVRRRDKVGRFGGDEFLIVLPETDPTGAHRLAERIRANIQKRAGVKLNLSTDVTASLGSASCMATDADRDRLLEYADRALYRAKSLGKNRAELWRELEPIRASE